MLSSLFLFFFFNGSNIAARIHNNIIRYMSAEQEWRWRNGWIFLVQVTAPSINESETLIISTGLIALMVVLNL